MINYNKLKIIYINYIDMSNIESGSQVRPALMYKAFLELGLEVELVTGASSKSNLKERKEYLERKLEKIKNSKFDFCYIENKTEPLFKGYNYFEYKFIKAIKEMDIPIGVFYRDVYWKFNKEFNLTGVHNKIMKVFQKFDLRFWKRVCKHVFLPTDKMNEYLSFKKACALPPACSIIDIAATQSYTNNIIYVGGISYNYGTDILLDAMRIVNRKKNIKLTLICRKAEYDDMIKNITPNDIPEWLEVKHISGKELNEAYKNADVAVAPLRKIVYYDFCMPVKIYEYISNRKPIITTNCEEIAKLIKVNQLGLICNDDAVDMAEKIMDIYADYEKYDSFRQNEKEFINTNRWTNRAQLIAEKLLK